MTSKERIEAVLHGEVPDLIPVDIGGSCLTGMHVSTVYKLRQALNLDPPGTPVKVANAYMMLGEFKHDLMEAIGSDVEELFGPNDMFGFKKDNWKEWELFDGTPVLVPEKFTTEPDSNGNIYLYPCGDTACSPSGRMPSGGYYFDEIIRQEPIDDDNLNPHDNGDDYSLMDESEISAYNDEVNRIQDESGRAIMSAFPGTSFGDVGLIPAPWIKDPKGIRDIEEWYISLLTRQDYVREVFRLQMETSIANLSRLYLEITDKISVNIVSGADFGTQRSLLLPPDVYRKIFKPFHIEVNEWIHTNTNWKTFIHSCGAIDELIPDFIDAGFDILNPVQTSAVGMKPQLLKQQYGKNLVFWGGGVDTQKTLPFGTPEQVRDEVRDRLKIFGKNGGFVFAPIHNIQANTPIENLLAVIETLNKYRKY